MNTPDAFDQEAIARRLAARADRAAPAGHRDRVLAAVRDTLAGRVVPPSTPVGLDVGGTTALGTLALSALLAVAAPWLLVSQALGLTSPEPRIVVQARAAGIDFPVELVATTRSPARGAPSRDAMSDALERRHEVWRLRTLVTGDL